jgi:hypothetical protein
MTPSMVSKIAKRAATWITDALQSSRHPKGIKTSDIDEIAEVLGMRPWQLVTPDAPVKQRPPPWHKVIKEARRLTS